MEYQLEHYHLSGEKHVIKRISHHEYEVQCDDCGYDEKYLGDFLDVIAQIKEDDWSIKCESGDWMHYCPDCGD